jgi:hypothetical protein
MLAWIGLAWESFAAGHPSIHPEHPRLFFRRRQWGPRGLTLAEVRARGAGFADGLDAERLPSPEGAPNLAMRYVITGDESAAGEAIRQMKAGYHDRGPWTTTQGDEIEAIAIAYDWLSGCYDHFSEQDRHEIQQVLVRGGRDCIKILSTGGSIYHTRMYAWANGALLSGLALYGDRSEAKELIDFGIRYYKDRLIPARRHLRGSWFNALSYGKKYMCRSVFSFLTAWRSATGENLWAHAKEHEGNWADFMLEYLMHMLRPDHRFAGYADIFNSMLSSRQGTMRLIAQATSETRNPYGQGFLHELKAHWGGPTYERKSRWYQVFEDRSIEARPRSELPLSRLFGRNSLGMVVMRSGWGPDDTWILFKCGDYGDNHGHFDQGHFEIFRKAELALDHFYWAKDTIHHNTILVNDPEDLGDQGNQRKFSRQVHSTLESYLSDPIVQTGDVLDYRELDATTYVLGDVTPAYDLHKVKSFTRQLVFVERRHLVIFDAITVAHARLRRRFLLHYPTVPTLVGPRCSWVNGEGQLITHTVLPEKAKISNIPIVEAALPKTARRFKKFWPLGRVEVEPALYDSPTTLFLHVLSPGDAGEPAPEFHLREDGDRYTLTIAGQDLVFGKEGRSFELRSASSSAG